MNLQNGSFGVLGSHINPVAWLKHLVEIETEQYACDHLIEIVIGYIDDPDVQGRLLEMAPESTTSEQEELVEAVMGECNRFLDQLEQAK